MRFRLHPGLLFLVALVFAPAALAEEDAQTREQVERLLHLTQEEGHSDAWGELERLGWERVAPLIRIPSYETWQARRGAIEYARRFGAGVLLYEVALQAIRSGDEDTALAGIELLEDAVRGEEDEKPRLVFEPRWWPDLLGALHATEVVVIDTFYSGPGFPSWNLTGFLEQNVHGHEEALAKATCHPDWRVRMMAVPFLGATTTGRTPHVVDALRSAFTDPHPKVRQMAVRAAAWSRWSDLVEVVGARLLDPEEAMAVRLEAAQGLEAFDFEDKVRAEPFLLLALQDESAEIRAAAAEGADGFLRTRSLVEGLLKALVDPEGVVRAGAAEGLFAYGYGVVVEEGVPIDEKALVRLLDDPVPKVRYQACRILAERGAVPASRAADLAARLTNDDPWSAMGAALALGALRGSAQAVLPVMRAARGRTPGSGGIDVAHALRDAVEAVEMAGMGEAELEALLASEDELGRRRAVREFMRRDDTPRLMRALEHRDPVVAIEAARHLAGDPEHTEAVVNAVLRVYPELEHYRAFHVFHRLGARLEPYVPRAIACYERTPSRRWFYLLQAVDVLEPHLREVVWEDFLRARDEEQIWRVANLRDALMPRVLEALGAEDESLRHGAASVVAAMRSQVVREHAAALFAALDRLDEADEARRVLAKALHDRDAFRGSYALHPWIKLR